ncbi:hypothetical protein ACFV3R_20210 [Streptomyces sp. NPDC059740]|uniref:hypothetical protein n=1 Tax=Streptomyces sp. NPDC059740 TaxID=3346926 RepID=UPI003647075A
MTRLRRPVVVATGIVLVLEAFGIVLLNWILGVFVDRQRMSLAGLKPEAMVTGTYIGGAVAALYLLVCAFLLLRAAVRDRAPGGFGRIVLITCAVIHGVVGALCSTLVSWLAFAVLMVVLALLVASLLAFEPAGPGTGAPREEGDGEPGPPADPAPRPL